MLRMGHLHVGDFTLLKLQKETCDMALVKQALHTHFLTSLLDARPFQRHRPAHASHGLG